MTSIAIQSLRSPEAVKAAGDNEYHQHLSRTCTELLNQDNHYSVSDIPGVLDTLDPFLDTLPYLYLLHKWTKHELSENENQASHSVYPGSPSLRYIVAFLERCDAVEIRYLGFQWRYLMEVLCDSWSYLSKGNESNLILEKVLLALRRIDPESRTLTSLHLRFLTNCLENRNYSLASKILDQDPDRLPHSSAPRSAPYPCSMQQSSREFITYESGLTAKLSSTDVLSYFLMGSMVYIAQLRWSRAAYMLELVLTVPTNNFASALMLEAYKKWLLVRLLLERKPRFSFNMTNQAAMKQVKAISKPYESLAEAYRHPNPCKLRAEVLEGEQIWAHDANQGLVLKVLAHHKEITIKKMQDVYVAVKLDQIADRLSVTRDEAKSYVDTLVEEQKLRASFKTAEIDGSLILHFAADMNSTHSELSEKLLRDQLVEKERLIKRVAYDILHAEQHLALCREHLEHARRLRKPTDDRGEVEEETIDMTYNAFESEDEENLMSELS